MPATPVLRISDLYGGTSTAQPSGGGAVTAMREAPGAPGGSTVVSAASAFTVRNVVLAWVMFVLIQIFLRLVFDLAGRVV